jgi:uncharacterized transporter YbjL
MMTEAGLPGLGMFELALIGIPVAIVGILVLLFVSPFVLARRRAAHSALGENLCDFAITMTVIPGGPLDQLSVEVAGLRHLQGVFLIEIRRGDRLISPVTPSTILENGDQLTFVGRADDVLDLQRIRGLSSSEQRHFESFTSGHHAFSRASSARGRCSSAGRSRSSVSERATRAR